MIKDPSFSLQLSSCHFTERWICCRYSRCHLFQNSCIIALKFVHAFTVPREVFYWQFWWENGTIIISLPIRKWPGVTGSWSCGSEDNWPEGRELRIPSIWIAMVSASWRVVTWDYSEVSFEAFDSGFMQSSQIREVWGCKFLFDFIHQQVVCNFWRTANLT